MRITQIHKQDQGKNGGLSWIQDAGVDIEAGYKSVELMKEHVKRTMREEVLGGTGRIFRGLFSC